MRKLDEHLIYYVYVWYRLDKNEPFYVGKGKDDRDTSLKRRNKHFMDLYNYLIRNNYGFKVLRLKDNLNEFEAFELEKETIKYFRDCGYSLVNIMDGGEGGDYVSTLSIEEKEIYSKKMSESCKGKNLGHRHTEESKQKMSLKASQRVGELNPFYGRHHSDETKRILSEKLTGRKNGFRDDEFKKKLSNTNKKPFCILYSDNKKEVYNSRAEAVKSLSERYPNFVEGHFRQFILDKNEIKRKLEVAPNYYIIGIFCLKNKRGEELIKVDDIYFDGNLDSLELYGVSHKKKVKVKFPDGKELIFESKSECKSYMQKNHDINGYIITKLIKSGEPINSCPCYYNLYKLNGLRIEEIKS